jgi:hypothetical protein
VEYDELKYFSQEDIRDENNVEVNAMLKKYFKNMMKNYSNASNKSVYDTVDETKQTTSRIF